MNAALSAASSATSWPGWAADRPKKRAREARAVGVMRTMMFKIQYGYRSDERR
jgi:hypothetical protein